MTNRLQTNKRSIKVRLSLLIMLAPFAVTFASCNVNVPVVPPLGTKSLQVTSNVEGDLYASDALAAVNATFYSVLANAKHGTDNIAINIIVPIQNTVPYTVDVASDPVAIIGYQIGTKGQYAAQKNFGSGTITITQVSPTIVGTFHGTVWLSPAAGSDTTRVLADGQFNAPF